MSTHAPPSHIRTDYVQSDSEALRRLSDTPFLLYAAAQGVKLSWSIIVKRWPELDSRQRIRDERQR